MEIKGIIKVRSIAVIVISLYVILEARLWYWGAGNYSGISIDPSYLNSYKLFKAVILAIVLYISVYYKSYRVILSSYTLPLLLLWCALTTIWSEVRLESLQQNFLMVGTIFSAALTVSLFGKKCSIRAISYICAIIIILSFIASIFLPNIAFMSGVHDGALRGLLPHKNQFGTFCAFSFSFLLYSWLNNKRNLYLAFSAALSLLGVLFSTSATAFILVLISAASFFYMAIYGRFNSKSRAVLNYVSVIIVSSAIFSFLNFSGVFLELLGRDPHLTGRVQIWDAVADFLLSNPILAIFGNGAGAATQSDVFIAYLREVSRWGTLGSSHNAYADVIINFGLIGLFGLLYIVIYVACMAFSLRPFEDVADNRSGLYLSIATTFLARGLTTSEAGLVASFPLYILMVAVFCINKKG